MSERLSITVIDKGVANTEEFHIARKIPHCYEVQPLGGLSEVERVSLAKKAADQICWAARMDGFDIQKYRYRGKSDESITEKAKNRKTPGFDKIKPIYDLAGMRVIFKTDEEIDGFVDWCQKRFDVPKEGYNFGIEEGIPWLKDFRKEKVKDLYVNPHRQPDYKSTHMRIPYTYDWKGVSFCDFLEIQAVTEEQYEINRRNREGYESSRLNARVNLNEELNIRSGSRIS